MHAYLCAHNVGIRAATFAWPAAVHDAMPSLIYQEQIRQLRRRSVQDLETVSVSDLQRPCKLLIPPHLIVCRLTDR